MALTAPHNTQTLAQQLRGLCAAKTKRTQWTVVHPTDHVSLSCKHTNLPILPCCKKGVLLRPWPQLGTAPYLPFISTSPRLSAQIPPMTIGSDSDAYFQARAVAITRPGPAYAAMRADLRTPSFQWEEFRCAPDEQLNRHGSQAHRYKQCRGDGAPAVSVGNPLPARSQPAYTELNTTRGLVALHPTKDGKTSLS